VYGVSHAAAAAAAGAASSQAFTLHSVDQAEREQVERLYNTLVAAKKKAGENVTGSIDSFTTFVQKKPNRSASSTTAKTSNTPSKSPTATSNSKPKPRPNGKIRSLPSLESCPRS
jgi:hypothetical protein